MHGAPLEAAREAVAALLQLLRGGTMGDASGYGVKLVTVETHPSLTTAFEPLGAFQLPRLTAGGLSPIGVALKLVYDDLAGASTSTPRQPRPLICLFTDGDATDPDLALDERAARFPHAPRLLIIVCGTAETNQSYPNQWPSRVLNSARLTEDQLRRALLTD